MAFTFKKATKERARLRLALIGPAGSGKTYSALAVASELVPGGRVAVIDTEHGSASKYADRFSFDTLEPDTFEPATYVEAIHAAEAAGFDVLIIDSLSHAWMGKGGALEMVDRAAKRQQGGNSFTAWRDVTPQHNALVEALLACRCHLVVTMRSKTEYVLEEDARGKKVPRKVGLAPVQRDGLEYEFDVVAELNADHEAVVTKTRCPALTDQSYPRPGADLAGVLRAWLTDGAEPVPAPVAPQPSPEELVARWRRRIAGTTSLVPLAAEIAALPEGVLEPVAELYFAAFQAKAEKLPTPAAVTAVEQALAAMPEALVALDSCARVGEALVARRDRLALAGAA